VNTETSEYQVKGCVFYDADCPLCSRAHSLFGRLFAQRGFPWRPLQTPGTASRLGLSEAALRQEMKLELANHQVLGGLDSWLVLLRSVWWLWPAGALLSLPGLHRVGQAGYACLARHRFRLARLAGQKQQRNRRKIPFMDLP
jgi:predicted DCC family thiol-disulfide oxidoreductase YuxK